jgi:ArsR family transcriptional regulator
MIATGDKVSVNRMFRAFSDKTRLRILHLLRGGELCVCDIMDTLRIPQAKTSRHLGYLRRAGLVKAREEGLWSFYSLTPAVNPVHEKLLDCLSVCCKVVPEIAIDDRRVGKTRKSGSCCP